MKAQKNRRYRNAKISEYKFRRVIECFAHDLTVRDAALKTKLSEPAIANIYMMVRMKLKTNGMLSSTLPTRRTVPPKQSGGRNIAVRPRRTRNCTKSRRSTASLPRTIFAMLKNWPCPFLSNGSGQSASTFQIERLESSISLNFCQRGL